MSLYLDHIFIITKPGAPVAKKLAEIGFCEGNSNTHPGQGTSNRRFFFDNFTIELLFVSDPVEAAIGAGSQLGILPRSKHTNASPFGVVVRAADARTTPTFSNWQYFPDYFPSDMCFYVGDKSDQFEEPLCICMPPSLPKPKGVPEKFANPGWQLSELTIHVPVSELSVPLSEFASIEKIIIQPGNSHQMELIFNEGKAGKSEDLTPDLPLIVKW